MNTINGDFIEKSIPNTKNATLNVNIGGVDSTMTVEKFASAIVIPPVLPSSTLKLDTDINSTLQPVKDVAGNSSQLQISNDVIKIGKTLLIGDPGTSSGTFTIQGNLAGQAFYDRLWNGITINPVIYTFYCNNKDFYLYKQDNIANENIMSFAQTSGYGKFINGTLYASKTTAEINAIGSPVESLTLWNSTLKTLCFYNGSTWINVKPYKSYVASITQTGTNAPVATVLENTLGGTVVWTRYDTGTYIGTLNNAFTSNKTACFVTAPTSTDLWSSNTAPCGLESTSVNTITLTSWSGAVYVDGLSNKIIEIRVYN